MSLANDAPLVDRPALDVPVKDCPIEAPAQVTPSVPEIPDNSTDNQEPAQEVETPAEPVAEGTGESGTTQAS